LFRIGQKCSPQTATSYGHGADGQLEWACCNRTLTTAALSGIVVSVADRR